MSVTLTSPEPEEIQVNISNGEWLAITAMAREFGILDLRWNETHDASNVYTPEELSAMADRAEQIGKAEVWLRELSHAGGAQLS